jgi:tight adherence protein B
MLLVSAFLIMMFLIFCTMLVVMRPTAEQKAIAKRLSSMRVRGLDGKSEDGSGGLLKEEAIGNFTWIDELLERFSITEKVQQLISQADSKTTIGSLIVTSFGLGVAGFFVAVLIVPFLPIAAAAGAVCAYAPLFVLGFRRNRRLAAFNKALPDAIDMIARSLRAGHSMIAAIGIVAEHAVEPVGSEFSEVFRKQNFGLPVRDALTQLLERVPSQDLRVLVTAILVQKDTGGNLAEILDRTVKVIRERLRIHGEIRTHTAQGRMTGWILCALPVVMLVLINMVNPGYSKVLFNDPFGRELLYVGMALLTVGGVVIRQIVNGIEV